MTFRNRELRKVTRTRRRRIASSLRGMRQFQGLIVDAGTNSFKDWDARAEPSGRNTTLLGVGL